MPEHERTHPVDPAQLAAAQAMQAPARPPTPALLDADAAIAGGDPGRIAAIIRQYPEEREAIYEAVHAHPAGGNRLLCEIVKLTEPTPTEAARESDKPGGFHASYRDPDGSVPVDGGSYEQYKRRLGDLKASSEQPAAHKAIHTRTAPITRAELFEIYPGLAHDLKEQPALEAAIAKLLAELNTAFRLLRFDTIEAQAVFLGNAYVESVQLRHMTEAQRVGEHYVEDPAKIHLNEGHLDMAADGKLPNHDGYRLGGSINRNGNWHESFIGRGPVQVTHRKGYLWALAVMEAMKMEHTIRAPADGKVEAVNYAVGDQVDEGVELIKFEAAAKA